MVFISLPGPREALPDAIALGQSVSGLVRRLGGELVLDLRDWGGRPGRKGSEGWYGEVLMTGCPLEVAVGMRFWFREFVVEGTREGDRDGPRDVGGVEVKEEDEDDSGSGADGPQSAYHYHVGFMERKTFLGRRGGEFW